MERIRISNIRKHTRNFVLSDINLKMHAGEIFALVGIQGSGKTLLCKILQKLAFPHSGTFWIDCKNTGAVLPDMMFCPNRTVYATLKMYAKLYKRRHSRAELMNVLNAVGLRRRRTMLIKNLTPNRYARLKIAVAIVGRPKVLILDTPFAYMSEAEARQVRIILKTLADRFGTTIILTGINFFDIEEIFDTMAIIDCGQIVCRASYNALSKFNDEHSKTCVMTQSPNYAAKIIKESLGHKTSVYGENEVIIAVHPSKAQEIYDFLTSNRVKVDAITRVNKSLDELFFHKLRTGEHRLDAEEQDVFVPASSNIAAGFINNHEGGGHVPPDAKGYESVPLDENIGREKPRQTDATPTENPFANSPAFSNDTTPTDTQNAGGSFADFGAFGGEQ